MTNKNNGSYKDYKWFNKRENKLQYNEYIVKEREWKNVK